MVALAVLITSLAMTLAAVSPAAEAAERTEEGSSILMAQLDSQRRSLSAEFARSGGIAGLSLFGRVAIAGDSGTVQSADNTYSRPLSPEELALFAPSQLEAAARQSGVGTSDPTRDGYVYRFKATLADGSAVTLEFGQRAVASGPAILGWIERACEAIWRARIGSPS